MQCCGEKEKQKGCCQEGGMCGGQCGSSDVPSSCDDETYSNGLDAGKFVLLTVLSMGLYLIYWYYRNWKHIKEHTGQRMRPAGRAVAAVFPVLDIILFCMQFKTIHALAKTQGSRSFSLVWVCLGTALMFVVSWIVFAMSFFVYGPALFGLFYVSLLGVTLQAVIVLPVQLALNDLWTHVQQKQPLRTSYTNGEKTWMVVGSLLIFISFLSIFFAPLPPLASEPDFGYNPEGFELQEPPDLQTPLGEQELENSDGAAAAE